ncbi:UNVERIFIED_CONTAM: hypothetical protein PYX00_006913 [Menopon gallinae]|uniref:Uncharacterized protein n=1 Tax=Menopon gallinae TaxID=328185 RepID=A0AAW2HGU7_9NEOP
MEDVFAHGGEAPGTCRGGDQIPLGYLGSLVHQGLGHRFRGYSRRMALLCSGVEPTLVPQTVVGILTNPRLTDGAYAPNDQAEYASFLVDVEADY